MIAASALTLVALLGAAATQDVTDDPAAAVARLFAERCGDCHSVGSDEPKAMKSWADADDLALTAANPKLVTVGDPDESDLFLTVDLDDMPPPDSDVAPLTDDEKALIAAWIRAGAPSPMPTDTDAEPIVEPGNETTATVEEASAKGWMRHPITRWASRHHPIIIHFPIALLVSALIAELLARAFKRPELRTTATFCLTLGALSALPSAGLGWLLAEQSTHHTGPIFWHRWLGVATAVLSLVTLWVACTRPRLRLIFLLAIGALVSFTGHLGGQLSYGVDWLQFPTLE